LGKINRNKRRIFTCGGLMFRTIGGCLFWAGNGSVPQTINSPQHPDTMAETSLFRMVQVPLVRGRDEFTIGSKPQAVN
jgi:hypothetical protein